MLRGALNSAPLSHFITSLGSMHVIRLEMPMSAWNPGRFCVFDSGAIAMLSGVITSFLYLLPRRGVRNDTRISYL